MSSPPRPGAEARQGKARGKARQGEARRTRARLGRELRCEEVEHLRPNGSEEPHLGSERQRDSEAERQRERGQGIGYRISGGSTSLGSQCERDASGLRRRGGGEASRFSFRHQRIWMDPRPPSGAHQDGIAPRLRPSHKGGQGREEGPVEVPPVPGDRGPDLEGGIHLLQAGGVRHQRGSAGHPIQVT